MSLLSLNTTLNPPYPPASCIRRKINFKHTVMKPVAVIPARDRAMDFGKYKGRLLGTLPSKYLKWVSKNLRARDFEEWAKLADEVLQDPVYRDRIEWESAQEILSGDVIVGSSSSRIPQNTVSELLDISEKFGWDNDDKLGWAKIDFGLLGTSKGGRIPRRVQSYGLRPNSVGASFVQPKLSKNQCDTVVEREAVIGDKRRERRERLKMKKRGLNSIDSGEKSSIRLNDKGRFGTSSNNKMEEKAHEDAMKIVSPFPGRESLIKKVLNRRR